MRIHRFLTTLCCLLVAFATAAAPRTFVIATAEGKSPGAAATELEGLLAHLNAQPEMHFTVTTYPSYDAAYDAFKAGKAELMLVGSVKYVQAHHEIGAIPVVAEAPKWQESVIVVATGSPIRTFEQLKGKRFAFGYEGSTTTDLLPRLLLSKHQMKMTDLKAQYLGSQQDAIVRAVVSGSADAGALATIVYEANKDKLRALDVSERVPGGTIVAHKEIDVPLFEKIRAAMVAYKPGPNARRQRFSAGAEAINDADFNKVRFLCKVLFDKTYH